MKQAEFSRRRRVASKPIFPFNLISTWLSNWYRQIIRHPKHRWWIIAGTLLYLVSPLDISPDVFPVLGWIDDGLLATVLVTEVSQLLVESLKERNQRQRTKSDDRVGEAQGNEQEAIALDPSLTQPAIDVPAVAIR